MIGHLIDRLLRRRDPNALPAPTGKTLDYRVRCWGHNLDGWKSESETMAKSFLFGPTPHVGDDVLVLRSGGGEATWRISAVEAMGNPADMFFVSLRFVSRRISDKDVV